MLAHDAERFAEVGHANIFAVTSDEKCTHPYVFYLTDANGNYTSIEIVKGEAIYIADNGNALRIYQDDKLSISLNAELTQHLEPKTSNEKEKPLNESERTTLYKMIYGMVIDGYGFNPNDKKSTLTGQTNEGLEAQLLSVGIEVSYKSIKKYIDLARELLESERIINVSQKTKPL